MKKVHRYFVAIIIIAFLFFGFSTEETMAQASSDKAAPIHLDPLVNPVNVEEVVIWEYNADRTVTSKVRWQKVITRDTVLSLKLSPHITDSLSSSDLEALESGEQVIIESHSKSKPSSLFPWATYSYILSFTTYELNNGEVVVVGLEDQEIEEANFLMSVVSYVYLILFGALLAALTTKDRDFLFWPENTSYGVKLLFMNIGQWMIVLIMGVSISLLDNLMSGLVFGVIVTLVVFVVLDLLIAPKNRIPGKNSAGELSITLMLLWVGILVFCTTTYSADLPQIEIPAFIFWFALVPAGLSVLAATVHYVCQKKFNQA